MYNDEDNLYHYTYRRDGSEPGQQYDARPYAARPGVDEQLHQYQNPGPAQPAPEPKKERKRHPGVRIAALALVCALLGGAVGGGIVASRSGRAGAGTEISVSSRPASEVSLKTVDGATAMTDAELYAANVNSVVSINVTGSSGTNYFGQTVQTASSGSGFVLTRDGYIATNYHVVKDAETVKVTMYNGDTYDAAYIGGDEEYDIAVIKIDAADLPVVVLGNSDSLNVGDSVLAIGNPLGELTFSMSEGIASSVNRAINVSGTPFNMIQVTCAINPGNSGGPLFNQYGEVVGIVSAKYSSYSTESVEGLGFAIPINDVVAMIQDIMTNGYISNKPYLGINAGTLTEQMAAQYRYDISAGVFVYSVEKGGAADQAGLKMGDVIVKIDGKDITSMEDLTVIKKQYSAGDTATFTIFRDGGNMEVSVTWDAVPEDTQAETEQNQQTDNSQYGTYGSPWDMFDYFFGNQYR